MFSGQEVIQVFHSMNLSIQVRDDENGRGLLQNDIKVVSQKAFPLLDVVVAKYGSPIEPLRVSPVPCIRRVYRKPE